MLISLKVTNRNKNINFFFILMFHFSFLLVHHKRIANAVRFLRILSQKQPNSNLRSKLLLDLILRFVIDDQTSNQQFFHTILKFGSDRMTLKSDSFLTFLREKFLQCSLDTLTYYVKILNEAIEIENLNSNLDNKQISFLKKIAPELK